MMPRNDDRLLNIIDELKLRNESPRTYIAQNKIIYKLKEGNTEVQRKKNTMASISIGNHRLMAESRKI